MQLPDSVETSEMKDERILWEKIGDKTGPVLVIFVGVHGNEPAGIEAIEKIESDLKSSDESFNGSVYAIRGNIRALKLGIRFVDQDLNRLWEPVYRDPKIRNTIQNSVEVDEIKEIKEVIRDIISRHDLTVTEFIFTDIHTTSSNSCSFIPFNDTLKNRELARKFPIPQILGIEEYIHGTLLSYINNLGFTAIGFEAGAHTDPESVRRSVTFIRLLLHHAGLLELPLQTVEEHNLTLKDHFEVPGTYYEIIDHYYVENPDRFTMKSGFKNFDRIQKGQSLAYDEGNLIEASVNGRIFMPLYQKTGNDGFFIIREISPVWLKLSEYLRKSAIHNVLKYLPGVEPLEKGNFKIDLRTARFLVKDIFHLLGYRVSRVDEHTLVCYRR